MYSVPNFKAVTVKVSGNGIVLKETQCCGYSGYRHNAVGDVVEEMIDRMVENYLVQTRFKEPKFKCTIDVELWDGKKMKKTFKCDYSTTLEYVDEYLNIPSILNYMELLKPDFIPFENTSCFLKRGPEVISEEEDDEYTRFFKVDIYNGELLEDRKRNIPLHWLHDLQKV